MDYKSLGHTGLKVSVVGVGCNNFGTRCDEGASAGVVHAALECGINFFDTADVYGDHLSEEYLGAAIKGMDRSQIIIATKFAAPMGDGALNRGASRHHVMNAVEASLKRLGTDYIDLYQQHGPDPATPVEETLAALDDLVRAGKVRYLGNSNYAGWQIADAHWTAKQRGLNRFVTAQNQYNLLDRRVEREVLPACQRFGLGMLPYFPLASGLLTGKYQRGAEPPEGSRLANRPAMGKSALTDHNFDVLDRLTGFAREQGHDLLELAMGWLASMPYVSSVISGATSPDQVRANVKSAEWRLTSEQMSRVAELSGRQGAR